MRWSLVRGAAVLVAGGASLFAIDASANATQLICLNAQKQFVACKAGTVPANPYVISPQSTESPTTIRRSPAVVTVPSTIPAPANVAPAPTQTTHVTPSGRQTIKREAVPIAVAVLLLGAVVAGFLLELRRRGQSSGEEAGVTDTAIVVTAAASVLSGFILLVLGVASDSRPTLYEAIGLAAMTGVLLIVFRRFFPPVERHEAAGALSIGAETALARVGVNASVHPVENGASGAVAGDRWRPADHVGEGHDVPVPEATQSAPTEPATDGGGRETPVDDGFPIANYDELSTVQIVSLLPHLDTDQLTAVRIREEAGKSRPSIRRRIDAVLATRTVTERDQDATPPGDSVAQTVRLDSAPDEAALDEAAMDEPALVEPALDEPALDEPAPDQPSPDEPRPVPMPERAHGEHATVARSNGHLRAAPPAVPATPAGPDRPEVPTVNGHPMPARTGPDAAPRQPATGPEPDHPRRPAVTRPAAAVTRRTAVTGPAPTTFRLPVARDLVDATFGVATFRRLSQAARDAVRDGLRQNRVIEAANSAANYLALGHAVDWSRQTHQRMVRDWRTSIDDDVDHERLERAASRCAYLRLLRSDLPDDVDRYAAVLRDRVQEKLDQRQMNIQTTSAAVYLFWMTGEWLPSEDDTPRLILAGQSDVATRLQRDSDRVVAAALTALWLGATRASRSSFGRG